MGREHLAAVARYRMVVWIESGLAKVGRGARPRRGLWRLATDMVSGSFGP